MAPHRDLTADAGPKRKRDDGETPESPWPRKQLVTSVSNVSETQDSEEELDPVEHWILETNWPAAMSGKASSSLKRAREDGTVPVEVVDVRRGTLINDFSKNISKEANKAQALKLWADNITTSEFETALADMSGSNESAVVRFLNKFFFHDIRTLRKYLGEDKFPYLLQDSSALWMWKMGGTYPMPDLFYGVSEVFFDGNQQLGRLQDYMRNQKPAKCTASQYFPLLVCEFKSSSGSLLKGNTQSKYAAATVVQAIIELCEVADIDKLKSLEGHFLCYSVVANNETIKIFGHFFRQGTDDKITHYCYTIAVRNFFDETSSANADDIYKSHILGLIIDLLERAYKEHLKLLKDLVERLKSSDPAKDNERPTRLVLGDRYPNGHTKKRTISGKSRTGKSSMANTQQNNVTEIEADQNARRSAELMEEHTKNMNLISRLNDR
ncbi:hypothetical protein K470DRAFT_12731 [Piedraia hortae CBS 480.64]|uniref:DUF7924 domain-containing protein n=1 Tax=Piedraia hortae CBS 480.64 TaxID=1314780 RepID=A0A6A7BP73_9PEZI|nr:hypothetical protein K470DRAFT_12731 [Piedraia hortae CBS 480.64]